MRTRPRTARVRIGEASTASGVPERMIRHYEKLGLIPPASRRASGYRDYTEADVARLSFIARARGVGVPLELTAELLAADDASRGELIERWSSMLEGKADDLVMLREQLADMASPRRALHRRELDGADLKVLRDAAVPEGARELDDLVD